MSDEKVTTTSIRLGDLDRQYLEEIRQYLQDDLHAVKITKSDAMRYALTRISYEIEQEKKNKK